MWTSGAKALRLSEKNIFIFLVYIVTHPGKFTLRACVHIICEYLECSVLVLASV